MNDHASNPSPVTDADGVSPVVRGIKGRCPRCGEGRLFKGYLKVADTCDVCGMSFHGHDTVPLKGMAVGLQYKYRSTEEETRPGGV